MPTVLALETSCDESAAAVLRQEGEQLTVLSHGIASQVEEHAKWGGVVPEIASRRHVEALPNLVEHALKDAGLVAADLDAIAATVAPGLVGALMVGSITGRTLAALHQKPFLAVLSYPGPHGPEDAAPQYSGLFFNDRMATCDSLAAKLCAERRSVAYRWHDWPSLVLRCGVHRGAGRIRK